VINYDHIVKACEDGLVAVNNSFGYEIPGGKKVDQGTAFRGSRWSTKHDRDFYFYQELFCLKDIFEKQQKD